MRGVLLLAGLVAGCGAPPPAPGASEPEDPRPARVRAAIERLRSESVEQREEAAREIRALGRAAIRELRAAAGDPDSEVRARVRALLAEVEASDEARLVLEIRKDGAVLHAGKALDAEIGPFLDAYGERRRREEGLGKGEPLRYPVLIRADRAAAYEAVQAVMLAAVQRGGVVSVELSARE